MNKYIIILTILIFVASCTKRNHKYQGHYKIGKPYKINHVLYKPCHSKSYSEEGIASWYGPNFHGKKTANGEIFNKSDLTAAHRTLPLPSMVKVTNLKTRKSLILRVNDRGPFAKKKKKRIIDVSEKAAEILGIKHRGIARVRVTLLPNATKTLHKKLAINQSATKKLALLKNKTKTMS